MIYFKTALNKNELNKECIRISNEIQMVSDNSLDRHNSIKILEHTPQILLDIGCSDLPILFSQSHVRNCLHPKGKNPHWHGLQKETLENLPFLISEPAIIYDSLTAEDSIVLVLNAIDDDNLPIIASLTPNGTGQYSFEKLNANYLTSVYGKNNLSNVLEKASEADFILYVDKEKSRELCRLARLQLPWGLHQPSFDIILHKSNNIVNERYTESTRFSYDYEALSASGRILADISGKLATDEPEELNHMLFLLSNQLSLNEQKEIYKMHMDREKTCEIIGWNVIGKTMYITSVSITKDEKLTITETSYIKSPSAVQYRPHILKNSDEITKHLHTYGYQLSDDGHKLLNKPDYELSNDKAKFTSIYNRLIQKRTMLENAANDKPCIEKAASSHQDINL